MKYRFTQGQFEPPATLGAIETLQSNLGFRLPAEYISFLLLHNGGEGFVNGNYIVLWRAEEIICFNIEYEVGKYAQGIVLFGSDGGGEGYGFDVEARGMPIVKIPFIGMSRRDSIVVAHDFSEFFSILEES